MQKICLGFDTPTDFSPTGLQEIIQKACKLSTGRHKGISAVDFRRQLQQRFELRARLLELEQRLVAREREHLGSPYFNVIRDRL